jgi:hypothetical protein
MVKNPLRRPDPLPRPKRDRKKATRAISPVVDELRTGRLMMRVHDDLLRLLDVRARERGESRSRYIEKLLLAFLEADPRNPPLDPVGRIDGDAKPPISKTGEALKFGERWARYSDLNLQLLRYRVPDKFLDDEWGYVMWEEKSQRSDENDS